MLVPDPLLAALTLRSLENAASLDMFNALHISCMFDETNYTHKVIFASCLPVIAVVLSNFMFWLMSRRPSIGVKQPGRAMSAEREKRDWFFIMVIEGTNM